MAKFSDMIMTTITTNTF